MRLLTLALAFALTTTSLLFAQQQAAAKDDAVAKAQAMLAQARAALGSEAKVKALQSLTINGKIRRVMGEREMEGELQFDILLPDKLMKAETIFPMPGMELSRTEVLNGAEVWTENNSSGHGNIVIRQGNDTPQGRALATRASRAELLRIWLGCLLTPPASAGLQYSFAGEAEAADGKANVLEVKGADGFAARLFLDQKSHRTLLLTYQGRKPRMMMTQAQAGGPRNEEEIQRRIKEAEAQAAAQGLVEFQMRFSDFREEGGLTFPHRITKGSDDEVNEEWELTKFKLNPPLKAEKFEKNK
jgi:hypothetical protein